MKAVLLVLMPLLWCAGYLTGSRVLPLFGPWAYGGGMEYLTLLLDGGSILPDRMCRGFAILFVSVPLALLIYGLAERRFIWLASYLALGLLVCGLAALGCRLWFNNYVASARANPTALHLSISELPTQIVPLSGAAAIIALAIWQRVRACLRNPGSSSARSGAAAP